jgi:hypothetical protein
MGKEIKDAYEENIEFSDENDDEDWLSVIPLPNE